MELQAGYIGLHWAGYIPVKVPNERPVSLFEHQGVLKIVLIEQDKLKS